MDTTVGIVRGRSTTRSSRHRRVRSQQHVHQRKPNIAPVEPIHTIAARELTPPNAAPVTQAAPQLSTEPITETLPALETLLPATLIPSIIPCPLIEAEANQAQASSSESAPPGFPRLGWEVSNTTSTASTQPLGSTKFQTFNEVPSACADKGTLLADIEEGEFTQVVYKKSKKQSKQIIKTKENLVSRKAAKANVGRALLSKGAKHRLFP